ncbi:unnamed protein product, partial [Symbiodinium sp. KB8]
MNTNAPLQYLQELAAKKRREERKRQKKEAKLAAQKQRLAEAVLGDRGRTVVESKLLAPTAAAEARRKEREELEAKRREEEERKKENALTPRRAEEVAKALRRQHKKFLAKLAKKQKRAEEELRQEMEAKEALRRKIRKAALKGTEVKSKLLQPTASFALQAVEAGTSGPSMSKLPLEKSEQPGSSSAASSMGTVAAIRASAREEVSSRESELRPASLVGSNAEEEADEEGADSTKKTIAQ